MREVNSVFLSIIVFILSLSTSHGLEVVDVKEGATIRGVVTFKGNVPVNETITIDKDMEYCGKERPLSTYIVSDHKVKNVVVWIEGIKQGKAFTKRDVENKLKK